MDNNRESIKRIINNPVFHKYGVDQMLINEMEKLLQISGQNKTIDEIITLTHQELDKMSFSTQKILGLRDKFINIASNKLNQNNI